MAYPAGFSSDEDDEFGGFMSDESEDLQHNERLVQIQHNVQHELTPEQKLSNLFFAIMNRNLVDIITALDEGLDLNVDLRDGWTPLMLAASVGNSEIAHELISRGADVNAERDKYTVLMAACSCPETTAPASKCLDIVMQLIENGADVNAVTRKRKTALMFAAGNGNAEVVVKLLSYCDITAEDNQGWNALFWAINDNQPHVVQILLDAGLKPDKADIRGNTAVHYAISQEFEDIIKLLSTETDTTVTTMQESFYLLENLFENQRPQFFRDICCMLYGMKCENLVNLFVDTSLSDFLSMDDSKLKTLGVNIPYQRNRILTGLHKFHRHAYKQKSIPIVAKTSIYSTIDVSNTVVTIIRQLITMEASLKYIADSTFSTCENKIALFNDVGNIRNKIHMLKKTTIALNSLTKTWDSNYYPVDFISHNRNRYRRWTKWLGFTSILLFTIMAYKVRRH